MNRISPPLSNGGGSPPKPARPRPQAVLAYVQAVLAYVLTCGPEEMRDLEEAHCWYQR